MTPARPRKRDTRSVLDALDASPATAPAGAADKTPAPTSAPARGPRVAPVKVTVEMDPTEHRQLRRFTMQAEIDLNLTTVAGAEVLRVLWALACEDERLADRVRRELKRTGGSRRRR